MVLATDLLTPLGVHLPRNDERSDVRTASPRNDTTDCRMDETFDGTMELSMERWNLRWNDETLDGRWNFRWHRRTFDGTMEHSMEHSIGPAHHSRCLRWRHQSCTTRAARPGPLSPQPPCLFSCLYTCLRTCLSVHMSIHMSSSPAAHIPGSGTHR